MNLNRNILKTNLGDTQEEKRWRTNLKTYKCNMLTKITIYVETQWLKWFRHQAEAVEKQKLIKRTLTRRPRRTLEMAENDSLTYRFLATKKISRT